MGFMNKWDKWEHVSGILAAVYIGISVRDFIEFPVDISIWISVENSVRRSVWDAIGQPIRNFAHHE